jgi:3-methyladenine DNA glycosylase AlkD
MDCKAILTQLRSMANPANVEGMARYGISTKGTLGVSVTELRKMAKGIGTDHKLAGRLWRSGVHEARILATLVDDPAQVADAQMERWAKQIDSWDIGDLCCNNLFRKTRFAHKKAMAWTARDEQFVKRAGFALIACLAVHDRAADDQVFVDYLPTIEREANDERNFVKKAVNWALRQVGKRNRHLNRQAVKRANRIRKQNSRSARWIASDALRELTSEKVQTRLG